MSFRSHSSRNTQHGFTLLEAIVAMVLVATFGLSILAWFNNNLDGMRRVERKLDTQEPIRSSLAFLDSVNMMERPSGDAVVGIYTVSWTSRLVEPVRDGVTRTGAKGLFQLGLYEVSVSVAGIPEPLHYTVRAVGWKQVRSPLEGIE